MVSKNTSKDYAVLVINNREHEGQAARALAVSLYSKLKSMKKFSSFISIHQTNLDSKQIAGWVINIESTRSKKRFIIEEFFFPPMQSLNVKVFLLWISRAVLRSIIYLKYKISEIWQQDISNGHILSGIINIIVTVVFVLFDTLFFIYAFPLISFVFIRTLQKLGNMALIVYLLAITSIIISLTWEQTLLPLVAWVARLTSRIVELVANSGLTFDVLFPVLSGVIFGASVIVIGFIIKIARGLLRRFEVSEEEYFRRMGELSYLLDPIYTATVKDNIERNLINLSELPNIKRIFVVCRNAGVLLAYEVLSNVCRERISTPVSILSHDLSLAGFSASPRESLWLLVDNTDWSRFSKSTPRRLSWHYLTRWPIREYTTRLISQSKYGLPLMKRTFEQHHRFKGRNSALVDSLLTLLKLA